MTGPDEQPTEHTAQEVADARVAYTAYGETTGGLNVRGEPMPEWDGIGPVIQSAWVATAAAVRARVEQVSLPIVLQRMITRVDMLHEGRAAAGRLYPGNNEAARERVCAWLRAHAVDPETVPDGAGFEIHDGQLTVETVVTDEDGNSIAADRGYDAVQRVGLTVPLREPFPGDG
ncbi:hypothetical protein AB0A95_30585 [Micromonospora sp. NPDC049230]|uniref:hypothetical protein n=1 Tax=Micromonospora sp. NPDC049230 TaxID=3155502 RepID=UPI0033D06D12